MILTKYVPVTWPSSVVRVNVYVPESKERKSSRLTESDIVAEKII